MRSKPGDIKHGIEVWIGVDLDGTLAHRVSGTSFDEIGDPIPEMVSRVERWLAQGWRVKIFTARASYMSGAQHTKIKAWCVRVFGQILDVTCSKDAGMVRLWDDRAVSVEHNTGRYVSMQEVE